MISQDRRIEGCGAPWKRKTIDRLVEKRSVYINYEGAMI